jgi:hypothetical protein
MYCPETGLRGGCADVAVTDANLMKRVASGELPQR